MSATATNILTALRRDVDAFGAEATAIRETLAEAPGAYFYMSLYALLMGAFSLVDLHSSLWTAGLQMNQTNRMRAYLDRSQGALRRRQHSQFSFIGTLSCTRVDLACS